MDRVSKLVALAVLATAGTVHAGYAQLAPPAGFGGSPAGWTFAPSANDATFGRVIHQPNGLKVPVPGTSTTMSASYRLASNAPRIAAAAIFANPYVRLGVGIASWLSTGKVVWDAAEGIWRQKADPFDLNGLEWFNRYDQWFSTTTAACQSYAVEHTARNSQGGVATYAFLSADPSGLCRVEYSVSGQPGSNIFEYNLQSRDKQGKGCPSGWTQSPAGCLSPALTQPQLVELLNPANSPGWPMPDLVPLELPPGTPLPVEPPVINPAPGPNPQPRPLFIPTGNPVPNPNYDPQQPPGPANQPYFQPGVRVVPSPTANEPWRVDLQPVNRPVSGPEPMTQPDSETPPDADKPSQEQLDFCVKNPDVLACQKLDEPEAQELPESEKDISISPDGGWGADNAACPAPKLITVQGRAIPIPFDLFCTWASGMRPIIIAMAWLSAAFILLGARNES